MIDEIQKYIYLYMHKTWTFWFLDFLIVDSSWKNPGQTLNLALEQKENYIMAQKNGVLCMQVPVVEESSAQKKMQEGLGFGVSAEEDTWQ